MYEAEKVENTSHQEEDIRTSVFLIFNQHTALAINTFPGKTLNYYRQGSSSTLLYKNEVSHLPCLQLPLRQPT